MNAWKAIRPFAHEILLAVLFAAVLVLAALIDKKGFVTVSTQQSMLFDLWDMALLTLPMTLIIITGGIDLSVGSTVGLASVTLGSLYTLAGWPIGAAAAAAIAVGLLCGLLNGFFITKIRIHPLIVTLATFSAYRGLAEGISLTLAAKYETRPTYTGFPESFTRIGHNAIPAGSDPLNPPFYALSIAGWAFVGSAILIAIVLAKAPLGRTLYAIGHNETAARYSGLPVNRAKWIIYALSGLMAGLVALNTSAYNETAKADARTGIELEVITAVVLGGTSIFGGKGRIIGTVLGVALLHETRRFVSWHWKQEEMINVVLGLLLIAAVAINALAGRKALRK